MLNFLIAQVMRGVMISDPCLIQAGTYPCRDMRGAGRTV